MNRRQALTALTATAALTAAGDAAAFRPRGPWLLEQAMGRQRRRNINTLSVQQEVTLLGLPGAPKGLVVPGKVLQAAPDGLRIERALDQGERLVVMNRKKTRIVEPGKSEQVQKTRPDMFYAFFTVGEETTTANAVVRAEKAIEDAKINTDVVSFTRFDGRVAYVVGCLPWEIGAKPCFILDKDTLLLMRQVTRTKTADGERVDDLRLLGWGSPEGGEWFPKTVERWENETLVERAVTRAVERNEALDRDLFAVG
jgi:hypothetical protein